MCMCVCGCMFVGSEFVIALEVFGVDAKSTVPHCNILQHTATHCNILQHTATHCISLQHTATHCNCVPLTTGDSGHRCIAGTNSQKKWILKKYVYIHTCMWICICIHTCVWIYICVYSYIYVSKSACSSYYRVAKTHRMPLVAGHFPQKSHWL